MEELVGTEFKSDQSSSYIKAENSHQQYRELIQVTEHIIEEDKAQVANTNSCPLTCDRGDLETVRTDSIKIEHVTANAVNSARSGRKRNKPRSYSPSEMVVNSKRKKSTRTSIKGSAYSRNVYINQRTGERFSCDMCQTPYIVNPERCSPASPKKQPAPRKYVDPTTGKITLLCNACGIAAKTHSNRERSKRFIDPRVLQIKEKQYLADSKNFAKKLSRDLNEPALATIYCPSFGNKGCYCIQNYLSRSTDKTLKEINGKALKLLSFHRKSRDLCSNSKLTRTNEAHSDAKNDVFIDDSAEESLARFRNTHYKCRSKEYEQHVLSTRLKLRKEYRLCEKATQKVLLYSNNFLHKKTKCSPEGNSRVEKQTRKTARLKPISEIHMVQCCAHKCTAVAVTHPNLLENWRKLARIGQRGAWKVIAEMLTPTGGTKANCHRFIRLITGSCSATISSVSDHIKKTKGDRSPPEHGLKKYWSLQKNPYGPSEYVSSSDGMLLSELFAIPSEEEIICMEKEVASTLLLQKRQQLEFLQDKLQKAESYLESIKMSEMSRENLSEKCIQGDQNKVLQNRVIRPAKRS